MRFRSFWSSAEEDSISAVLKSISRKEWLAAAAVGAVVVLLGLIPVAVALMWGNANGLVWNGRPYFSAADFPVYLSYIAQAKRGVWGLENMATTEHIEPVANVFWYGVGVLARVLHLSPTVAFYVSRVMTVFAFVGMAYASFALVFKRFAERFAALLLLTLASGFGLLVQASNVIFGSFLGAEQTPIDLWVPEATVFMSALYSPHFTLSWAMFIAVGVVLLRAYETGRLRYGIAAGLLGLVHFQFHPYHAITLWTVGGITLIALTIREGFRFRCWLAGALFVACSAPSVAYHYWLTHLTDSGVFMMQNNNTMSPSVAMTLLGFGALLPFAATGAWLERRPSLLRPAATTYFAVWAVVQLCLTYAPLNFQRRLSQGVMIPLVALAVPALFYCWQRFSRYRHGGAAALVIAMVLFLPSSFGAMTMALQASVNRGQVPSFFAPRQAALLQWVSRNTSTDAVTLSGYLMGGDLLGWGERWTYASHWGNTMNLAQKGVEVSYFFSLWTEDDRRAFVDAHDIDYVVTGAHEADVVDTFRSYDWLEEQYADGPYAVFAVRPTAARHP